MLRYYEGCSFALVSTLVLFACSTAFILLGVRLFKQVRPRASLSKSTLSTPQRAASDPEPRNTPV